jgi:kumamolisin
MFNRVRREQLRTRSFKIAGIMLHAAVVTAVLFDPPPSAIAQLQRHVQQTIVIPKASQSNPADTGLKAHANVRFLSTQSATPDELPPFSGYGYETPASFACEYGLAPPIFGCNPNDTTVNSSGGTGTIAIVDAFDDPDATANLKYFSTQFGIPFSASKFQVVYASGVQPSADPTGGWELEESLDIEYSHAMAPKAMLYLVEANSNSFLDLFTAIQVANNLVQCRSTGPCPPGSKGKGAVSMSWGGSEFPLETELDSFFTAPGVIYFAGSGDSPGTIYPCVSPYVVCAGGTSLARNEYTGNLIAEIAWSDAGGGISEYESIPPYQINNPHIAQKVGSSRGVPDVSADSNPNTGAWVYDSFPLEGASLGWLIAGGTSLATPLWAGILDGTGNLAPSSSAELMAIYGSRNRFDFRDIVYGACGFYSGTFSAPGWDLCTGWGSPQFPNNLR